ncbi:MAG: hypothetical protein K6C97_01700 [Treponema sp.]|nr:hypothetical protein [Treponema sp.]
MKMVKKVLFSLVAAAAVVGFAGCKFGAGTGTSEGTKWNNTMTVDGSGISYDYRRYWKQFSSSEKVAEITTTVTIDTSNCVTSNGTATAGLIFDLNKNTTDTSKVDFNLIGIRPDTGFYVERYTGITKQTNESLDTDDTTLGSYTSLDGKSSGTVYITWASKNISNTPDGTVYTYTVKISQSDKVYTVKINDVTVATYDASGSTYTWTKSGTEYAVGGIACYGSVAKDNKIVATYETEKSTVTGNLYEEVEY